MRSPSLNARRRANELSEVAAGEVVDVLVIGGGVTGTGVALDAASRGLSVALVERHDLAHGTSRWSSKLVHGGLRYLAHGELALAYESARERGVLMERTAPHLVRALPMVMPLTPDLPPLRAAAVDVGYRFADLLRMAARTSRRTLPRPRRISTVEALRLAPGIRRSGLRGALLFWDGQLEDDARLVIALARTAAASGARILTYCSAVAVDGAGALIRDERDGGEFALRAHHVVNATGVWADQFEPQAQLRPSKGAHLVIRGACLGEPQAAITVPVPGAANRWVFALPQPDGHAFVGLTDDPLDGPIPDVAEADDQDAAFLLTTISRALAVPLGPGDVIGRFAGLRPLLAGGSGATADLSRRHRLLEAPDGLLTLIGGKLTTYRRMAQDAIDRISGRPGVTAGPCRTTRLALIGAASQRRLDQIPGPPRLVRRYGTEAPLVAALADDEPSLLQPLAPGLSTLGVEIRFGLEHEGALTVDDLLDRRTRLGLVPIDRDRALPATQALLERHLPLVTRRP